MSEHTLGRWIIHDRKGSWSGMEIKEAGQEDVSPGICLLPPGPNERAHASLIAATPDLLRALKLVPLALAPSQTLRDWWENTAKPAIAKAEGGQD